ncbi:MAG: hypothetical protein WAT74_02075 [Flavobacteriales bacterium]
MSITVEAYYPLRESDERRHKGLVLVVCSGVRNIQALVTSEFGFDLALPYCRGNDVKANEVYHMVVNDAAAGGKRLTLDSDFLKLDLICADINVDEVEN